MGGHSFFGFEAYPLFAAAGFATLFAGAFMGRTLFKHPEVCFWGSPYRWDSWNQDKAFVLLEPFAPESDAKHSGAKDLSKGLY